MKGKALRKHSLHEKPKTGLKMARECLKLGHYYIQK